MKTLGEMIVTFTKSGLDAVSLTPSVFGTEVRFSKKGRGVETVFPRADLRSLADEISVSSHGLYMTGWDAKVRFNKKHQVTNVEFRRLDRVSARSHSPEREYLLAANS